MKSNKNVALFYARNKCQEVINQIILN